MLKYKALEWTLVTGWTMISFKQENADNDGIRKEKVCKYLLN